MTARFRRDDESGASLIIALIFVSVVAIVIAAVLTFADSNLRSSVALRDQAAEAASADGAAQIAINALRQGTYTGAGQCFGASGTLTLSGYYQRQGGPDISAAVTCAQDTTNSAAAPITSANKPSIALLTTGTSETGIDFKINNGGVVKIQGEVFSNSSINVEHGTLNAGTFPITARGTCGGTGGTIIPTPTCGIGAGPDNDPNYAVPTAPATPQSVNACSSKITFVPGLYDNADLNDLNNRTKSSCAGAVLWFQPGTYYFTFNGTWEIQSGKIVAGEPSAGWGGSGSPSIPGACQSPIPTSPGWTPPAPGKGVQFVFGGTSRLRLTQQAQVELCGNYSATGPPVVVYGLKSPGGPGGTVPAQSGCITNTGSGSRCAFLTTDNQSDAIKLYIHGTTYVPRGAFELDLRKSTEQYFWDGLVARRLTTFAPGSANPPNPMVAIPVTSGGPARTVVYLTVYVCPGGGGCDSVTGRLRLRAKVGFSDPSGSAKAGEREVTVYSWSVLR